MTVQPERIRQLNGNSARRGAYVLYWMQASQRASCNHALEHAVRLANERGEPLIVYLGLTDSYPDANARHYRFMLEGLRETRQALHDRGISFVLRHGEPQEGILEPAKEASILVCDRGYLRFQRDWRRGVAQRAECPVVQVETDAIVPVDTVSQKEEYSAATLRKKLGLLLLRYLGPLEEETARIDAAGIDPEGVDITDIDAVIGRMDIDRSVDSVADYPGGTSRAVKRLREFIEHKLDDYDSLRNDPNRDAQSGLSPYLHFGQISPLAVALAVNEAGGRGADAFLEELVIRRELSLNYVTRNPLYDSFEGLPKWSREALLEHAADMREYIYSLEDLENARTHDPYWNAAQREMVRTGKMHGYMRMYWGKKIIEWTADPRDAFRYALFLNNKYELDGRDPNGYAGVAWCFGKHDRPWATRPVFGPVRYMNANGLRRKFDADRYAARFD